MCAILLTNDGSFDANPPLRSLRPDCSFLGPQWQFRIYDVRRCPIPWFQQRFHDRIMLCKTKEHTAFEATPPHREAASKWSTTGRSCCEGRACKLKQPMMWVCLEMGHTHIALKPSNCRLEKMMKHGCLSIISILGSDKPMFLSSCGEPLVAAPGVSQPAGLRPWGQWSPWRNPERCGGFRCSAAGGLLPWLHGLSNICT